MLRDLIVYFKNTGKKRFILTTFFLLITLQFSGSFIIKYFVGDDILSVDFLEGKSLLYIFITSVIIGPLIETFLFQYCVIELILYFKKNVSFKILALFLSALLFGLAHYYNIYYIVFTLIIGFVFAFIYLIGKERNDTNGFRITWLAHIVMNLIAFVYNDLLFPMV
ncbi:type II CAAX prenyl endopeptidase Rce1 family protein [Ascidiimonas aurantiaca]|uniref:CPBP family glutamic-type intramembrane protease n=1 Tax=Ascidiimonas aurantiaca TaxID=1685432 RepID=UPI003BB6C2FB